MWYKRTATRLFTLLSILFKRTKEVKSDYYNILDSSFYVCATGFDREKFLGLKIEEILQNTFEELMFSSAHDDVSEHAVLSEMDEYRSVESDGTIHALLHRVEQLRVVHEQSSQRRFELL